MRVVNFFKDGMWFFLIVIDVVVRGFDIFDVEYVINYSFLFIIEDYVY